MEYISLIPLDLSALFLWYCTIYLPASDNTDNARRVCWHSLLGGLALMLMVISVSNFFGLPEGIVISSVRYQITISQIAFFSGFLFGGTLSFLRQRNRSDAS